LAVIPQFGVDPEVFRPAVPDARPAATFVAGYAGRLVPEKGVDLLLQALAQLPAAARAHIVGAGPEQARLCQLAAELGLADRVTWTPLVPSTEMPGVLTSFDCLVLPSRTRPNWKEQFGRVVMEAMACGVPVIGSSSGELPNVIGDAGLIFPEGDAAALAEQLRQLWQQPPQRAALAARGRAQALARYTQRRVAEDTVAFYRRLVPAGVGL
jgi:glycosyltransferase involved in cell wall biosynthesis